MGKKVDKYVLKSSYHYDRWYCKIQAKKYIGISKHSQGIKYCYTTKASAWAWGSSLSTAHNLAMAQLKEKLSK